MKKFNPYLVINNRKELNLILEKHIFPSDNAYVFSKNELQSEEDVNEEVEKIKDFYSFTPKNSDKDFINDALFQILILEYLREKSLQFAHVRNRLFTLKVSHEYIDKLGVDKIGVCAKRYLLDYKSFIKLHQLQVEKNIIFYDKYLSCNIDDKPILNNNNVDDILLKDFVKFLTQHLLIFLKIVTAYVTDFKLISLFLNSSNAMISEDKKIKDDTRNIALLYFLLYK